MTDKTPASDSVAETSGPGAAPHRSGDAPSASRVADSRPIAPDDTVKVAGSPTTPTQVETKSTRPSASSDGVLLSSAQDTTRAKASDPVKTPTASHASPGASSTSPGASSGGVPPVPPRTNGGGLPPARRPANFAWLVILLVVLCVAMGAALWMQRQASVASGMNIAARLDSLSNALEQSRQESRQALSMVESQASKLTALEAAVRENDAEYTAIEQAWQDFNDTTNDGVLSNDIERLLTIASQQLRLGGSVNNAIVALETAQARLSRVDRPSFATVQQAINGDLDRLRAVPSVDINAESARIERLSNLISQAPLLVPDGRSVGATSTDSAVVESREAPAAQPTPVQPQVAVVPPDAPWWQHWRAEIASWPSRAGSTLAHEMGDLIRVQRVDQPEALLLNATQADQLRAGLRQRLQTVQLALMMRQATIWKNELAVVSKALNDYYAPASADTQAALRLTESLAQTPVAATLPEINNSLNAMAALRAQGSTENGRD